MNPWAVPRGEHPNSRVTSCRSKCMERLQISPTPCKRRCNFHHAVRSVTRTYGRSDSGIGGLPDELLASIFVQLPCVVLLSTARMTCRRWYRVCCDAGAVPLRWCDPRHRVRSFAKRGTNICRPRCLFTERVEDAFVASDCFANGETRCRNADPSPTCTTLFLNGVTAHDAADVTIRFPKKDLRIACAVALRGDTAMLDRIQHRWGLVYPRAAALLIYTGAPLGAVWCTAKGAEVLYNDEVACASAWTGRVDVLKRWARATCRSLPERAWQVAAGRGHIEWLTRARRLGFLCPYQACALAAAIAGHVDIVRYMGTYGWRGDIHILDALLLAGALDVGDLFLLLREGWAVAPRALSCSIVGGRMDVFHALYAHLFYVPAGKGDRRPGMHQIDLGDTDMCALAARHGHLDCLAFLHGRGHAWDAGVCRHAARHGHLDCLMFAHTHGCPWDQTTCRAAAKGGHLECLWYARDNRCPWDAKATMAAAAAHGQLQCMAFLHNCGCAWDKTTILWALFRGHRECTIYAHRHGCPCDPILCARQCAAWEWNLGQICPRAALRTASHAPLARPKGIEGPPRWARACAWSPTLDAPDPWDVLTDILKRHTDWIDSGRILKVPPHALDRPLVSHEAL